MAMAAFLFGCQHTVDLQQSAQNSAYWQDMLQQARDGKLPAYVSALTRTDNFALLENAVKSGQFQIVLSGAPQADSWAYAQALAQTFFRQGTPVMVHLLLEEITQAAVDSQLDEVQYVEFLRHVLSYMQQQLGKKFVVMLAFSQLPRVQQFHSIATDKTWTQKRFEENFFRAVRTAIPPSKGQILWLDDLPKDSSHVQLVQNVSPLQLEELSAVEMEEVFAGYKQQLENRLSIDLNDLLFEKLIQILVAYSGDRSDVSGGGSLQLGVDVLQSWSQRSANGRSVSRLDQENDLLTVLSGVLHASSTTISQSAAWIWDRSLEEFDEDLQQNPALYQQHSPVGRSRLASLPGDLYARIAKSVASVHSVFLNLDKTQLSSLRNYVAKSLTDINTDVSSFVTLVNVQDAASFDLTQQLINALNGLSSRLSSSSVQSLLLDELDALKTNIALLRSAIQ